MARNTRNPKNNESPLFRMLTRMFAGPMVNYRRQGYSKNKRVDLDKYKYQSAGGLSFHRSSYDYVYAHLKYQALLNQNRIERYNDFEQMEFNPYLSAALDIYASEITTFSALSKILKIQCPNEEIKGILQTLFYDVLNVEFNLFSWVRQLVKFGDLFIYLDLDPALGIKNILALPIREVERLEGEDKKNPNYIQFQWNSGGLTFENWQMAHFRILGNEKYSPYGQSILDSARRSWRQLDLIENFMMSYRMIRASERRVYYIDVGSIDPKEVEQYVQKTLTSLKRNSVIDSDQGRVDLRYSAWGPEDDIAIAVRGNSQTKVEQLPGGAFTGDIDDIKYIRQALFAAIKIPESFLIRGSEGSEDKSSLAQRDVIFSRVVQRIQLSVISELEKIAMVHLFTLGFRDKDLLSFKLELNNPSKIADLQELDLWKTKFEVASSAAEGYFSKSWIAKKMFGMSEEEFVRNQRELFYDAQQKAKLAAIAEPEEGPGGGGAGDILGGEGEAAGEGDLGGEEETPETEEGDQTLLAAPAKREDEPVPGKARLTPNAKGKVYVPTTHDDRPDGARIRHSLGQLSNETGRGTKRKLFTGYQSMASLAHGIAEEMTNYKKEEKRQEILVEQVEKETQELIEELEKEHE